LTTNKIAGEKVNCGRPFNATKLLTVEFDDRRHDGTLRTRSGIAVPDRHADPWIFELRLIELALPRLGC
jgi:hypothetical protein